MAQKYYLSLKISLYTQQEQNISDKYTHKKKKEKFIQNRRQHEVMNEQTK